MNESISGTDVLNFFRKLGQSVSVAESCTGGMVAAALTDPAGASSVFHAGFVTYSNASKVALLGVSPELLNDFGAVSEEVAGRMAENARTLAEVDVAVSITGIAGPGPSEFKPEGRVCFGRADARGVRTFTVEFGALGRAAVREASTQKALSLFMSET